MNVTDFRENKVMCQTKIACLSIVSIVQFSFYLLILKPCKKIQIYFPKTGHFNYLIYNVWQKAES